MGCFAPFFYGGRSKPSATARCSNLLRSAFADVRSPDDVIALEFGRLHPDFQFTPIKEGIQRSVDWFFANYDTARK